MTSPPYLAARATYPVGQPRVFIPFEDRSRDLSGLLEFGTVVQIFPASRAWQLTDATVEQFTTAVRAFFRAHEFLDRDFVAALGDPTVIATVVACAAAENRGRVPVLRWSSLRCATCGQRRPNPDCASHEVVGRYVPINLRLPFGSR